MLAIRIIPTLLHRGDTLVKGKRFESWRSVGHIAQAARIHAARGVDELCILNIAATPEGKGPDFEQVRKLTEGNFTPVSVGGGVKTVEDVEHLLKSGADKVVIGHAAHRGSLIYDCAARFGSQAIVLALDVVKEGERKRVRGMGCGPRPRHIAIEFEQVGVGEILLTSVDQEGTLEGYDLELIFDISSSVSVPVIAHGGCGSYQDMADAIDAGASAVAAGALFQFTDCTPKGAAQFLKAKGYEVRT